MDLTCDLCDKPGFASKASLSSHKCKFHPNKRVLAKHLNTPEQGVTCPFCYEVFDRIEELKPHFKKCDYDMEDIKLPPLTAEELKDYQKPGDEYFCEECSEGFHTFEDLMYHQYMCHPACLKCGVSWPNTRQYNKHVQRCTEKFDPNKLQKRNEATCPICYQVDYNHYQLKRHLESEHSIRKRKLSNADS